ncbi:unnamed protein product [Linum trigynum]|uniref:Uncharacterized protein n=1 Tax=Linum trigynum TaxID=586398 RepID=A0AAV2D1B9_9ROSI
MAKLAMVALILCAVLFNFVVSSRDVDQQLKYCPSTDVFPGGCGGQLQEQCLLDVLGKYGASSMPKNCSCTPSGAQHICNCQIVCRA